MTDSGKAEARYLAADHACAAGIPVEQHAFVPERREVAGDGQRCGTRADQRDPLAVALGGALGQAIANVFLVVGGDALQPADGDRLGLRLLVTALLDAAAAARGLAGPVAGAAQDARKDIGLPVDEVGVAVAARRDQANVFGNRRVRRARPLAIDDLVEVVGLGDIRRFQTCFSCGGDRSSSFSGGAPSRKHVLRPDLYALPRMLRLRARRRKPLQDQGLLRRRSVDGICGTKCEARRRCRAFHARDERPPLSGTARRA